MRPEIWRPPTRSPHPRALSRHLSAVQIFALSNTHSLYITLRALRCGPEEYYGPRRGVIVSAGGSLNQCGSTADVGGTHAPLKNLLYLFPKLCPVARETQKEKG
jgi:hypothetical protein